MNSRLFLQEIITGVHGTSRVRKRVIRPRKTPKNVERNTLPLIKNTIHSSTTKNPPPVLRFLIQYVFFWLLQTLQDELRNSEAKGSGLERQVSQLSARMNRAASSSVPGGGGGASSRSSGGGAVGGGNSGADSGGAGWEGGDGGGRNVRGAEVTEAEIASLRRQMKAATQVSCYLLVFRILYLSKYFSETWRAAASASTPPHACTKTKWRSVSRPLFRWTNGIQEKERGMTTPDKTDFQVYWCCA